MLSDHPCAAGRVPQLRGHRADVDRIRALGDYYFGINGIVTFKNPACATCCRAIGPGPHPHRNRLSLPPRAAQGKRNESSFIPLILAQTAAALGVDTDVADATTTANARRLFKYEPSPHRSNAGAVLLYKSL